jgi:small subunit ribosomal protein S17
MERWQAGVASDEASPAERFQAIERDVRELVQQAVMLAAATSSELSDEYDRVVHLADKWCSLAAYSGWLIPFSAVPGDRRHHGEEALELQNKKRIVGVALRDSMHKTVPIAVTSRVMHPIYGKAVTRTTKFLIHDEYDQCKAGDWVVAMASRPLSKKKHHSFLTKIQRSKAGRQMPTQLSLLVDA